MILFVPYVLHGCGNSINTIEHERNVYKSLLSHMGGDDVETLVIRSVSVRDMINVEVQDPFEKEKLAVEAHGAYVVSNEETTAVPIDTEWDSRVVLVTEVEHSEIFSRSNIEQNWESFYKRYPKAKSLIGLSRVGFNKELTEAVVYVEFSCGPLCGSGKLAYLKRGLFGWFVELVEGLWVA